MESNVIQAYLDSLRPCQEFDARRALFKDGMVMPDDEIVQRHTWIELNIGELRPAGCRVQHRDGSEIKCREMADYLRWLQTQPECVNGE